MTPAPPKLFIPDGVLAIARRLEAAGYETWCVGGAVRDNVLGYPNTDFDLATAATPRDVRRLFRRTVPVGIEHGTVAVLDESGEPHEVTTFRRDVKTDGRHAEVEFGVRLEDDLARRDFTINAIAYHPLRHEWRDPFGGFADMDRRLLRAVGEPAQRFREDYLRILRLLRFAARFGFTIEPATWAAAREHAAGLAYLSAERVRDEWFKGLATAAQPSRLLELWRDAGAVARWLPELESRITERAERLAADALPRDPVLVTSYLSADPQASLRRLKCSGAEIERGRRIGAFREDRPDPSSGAAVRRWLSRVGDAADDLVAVALARDAAIGGAPSAAGAEGEGRGGGLEGAGAELAAAVRRVRMSGAPLTVSDLAVSGDDLLEAGVPQGPEVGRVLRRLLDAVLEEPARNTRDELLALARRGGEAAR